MKKHEHPVQHINADDQPEVVRQFLLSLEIDAEGSIIEVGGKRLHISQSHDPEAIASIQRGYDEMVAGKGRPLAEVDAEIRESLGFTPRES